MPRHRKEQGTHLRVTIGVEHETRPIQREAV